MSVMPSTLGAVIGLWRCGSGPGVFAVLAQQHFHHRARVMDRRAMGTPKSLPLLGPRPRRSKPIHTLCAVRSWP